MGLISVNNKKVITSTGKISQNRHLINKSALNNFYMDFGKALDDATHEMRALFIGDSLHKYSIFFSDKVKLVNDGGAGIVEIDNNPYSASGLISDTTANFTHYDQDSTNNRWGFLGSSIYTTNNAATIRIGRGTTSVTTARLWYYATGGTIDYKFSGGATTLTLDGTGLSYKDITWDGAEAFLYFENITGTILIYAIELIDTGYIGDHFGNGGITALQVSQNMDNLVSFASLRQHRLVCIMLGANDLLGATTATQLKGYIDSIISDLSDVLNYPSFLVLTPNYCYSVGDADDNFTYISKVRDYYDLLVTDKDIATFDMGALWGLFTVMDEWGLADPPPGNIIHPTTDGYKLEGYALFKELKYMNT